MVASSHQSGFQLAPIELWTVLATISHLRTSTPSKAAPRLDASLPPCRACLAQETFRHHDPTFAGNLSASPDFLKARSYDACSRFTHHQPATPASKDQSSWLRSSTPKVG